MLEIHVEETENYTLCRPSGELDAYTVGAFRESLASLAEVKRLLIDLSDVPFMDSAGLGALIGGIRRTREAEGAVVVACNRPPLTRLLHTTGFDRIVSRDRNLGRGRRGSGRTSRVLSRRLKSYDYRNDLLSPARASRSLTGLDCSSIRICRAPPP